ncbi:YcaO-like family protein [Massilia sp. W12]|uniref:YcaO-like family protein n=1 Tax=Massilia sp. W12 TaxID=3126507 RepID=UPI0030D5EA46
MNAPLPPDFLTYLPDGGRQAAPLDLPTVWRQLVDARFGVIRLLLESCRAPEFPQLHIAAAVLSNPAYFCANDAPPVKVPMGGAGAGITREQCLWSTVGEAVERYCGGVYGMEQFEFGLPEEMAGRCFPMQDWILYSQEQYDNPEFPFGRLQDQTSLQWVKGQDLINGDELWLPAQLIYFGLQVGQGEALTQTVSTGMACGADYSQAIASGFREALERDVFMAMWLLRYQPQQIELDAAFLQQLPAQVQAMLASPVCQLTLWYLPNEFGAITVLACCQGRHSWRIGFGASCHFSLLQACEKAIVEACHTWVWSTRFADSEMEQAQQTLHSWGKLAGSKEHVSYYLRPEMRAQLSFLLDSPGRVQASALQAGLAPASLHSVAQKVHASGRCIGWADLSTADVAQTGLRVVKVLISDIQPLYFGNPACFASQQRRRLQQLADFWGMPMPAELNPAPHPFP